METKIKFQKTPEEIYNKILEALKKINQRKNKFSFDQFMDGLFQKIIPKKVNH